MLIANPIYDVVFKYLLEDNKIAKLLIGAIIGEKIETLDFRPQEYAAELDTPKKSKSRSKKLRNLSPNLTVYRLDFSAKIRNNDGTYRLVVVELQKAKFPTDVMRFRRYLGGQYALKENVYRIRVPDKKDPTKYTVVKKPMPIISVYFLGHRLNLPTGHPVVRIQRHYIDNTTGERIEGADDFIEGLTHDSFVIQIPDLPMHRRNGLEQLLNIFDQTNQTQDFHILNVDENDFPEQYRPIIRRLQQAIAVPEVRNMMNTEDEIIEELEDKDREVEEAKQEAEEAKQEAEEAKQKAKEAKQEAEIAKQEVVEKDKTIEDQLKIIEELKQQLTNKK